MFRGTPLALITASMASEAAPATVSTNNPSRRLPSASQAKKTELTTARRDQVAAVLSFSVSMPPPTTESPVTRPAPASISAAPAAACPTRPRPGGHRRRAVRA